jgi:uncharacterized membrane protein YhaH (DUF805 family)
MAVSVMFALAAPIFAVNPALTTALGYLAEIFIAISVYLVVITGMRRARDIGHSGLFGAFCIIFVVGAIYLGLRPSRNVAA